MDEEEVVGQDARDRGGERRPQAEAHRDRDHGREEDEIDVLQASERTKELGHTKSQDNGRKPPRIAARSGSPSRFQVARPSDPHTSPRMCTEDAWQVGKTSG